MKQGLPSLLSSAVAHRPGGNAAEHFSPRRESQVVTDFQGDKKTRARLGREASAVTAWGKC